MENRFVTANPRLARARGARTAALDPILGYTQSYARTFTAADRVLVVLIENGGVDLGIPDLADKILEVVPGSSLLPAGAKDKLVDHLRQKIKSFTDNLLENAELTLNRYSGAKPSLFGDVVVLRNATASYDDLKRTLIDLTRAGKIIDVLVLTHGDTDYIWVAGGITGDKLRDIKDANGGPLSIRMVYMMNCVGASLNQAWLDAGARASAGSVRNNYLPEPTTYFFWQSWKSGQGFETSVISAYRKTVNLMNDAVRAFVRQLPGGSMVADSISLDNLEFVKDSAPVVQGSRGVTINTDDLSTAQASSLATTVLHTRILQSLSAASSAVAPQRQLSAAGLAFIKGLHTFRARLHTDHGGYCAIGYGTRLHAGACDGRPAEEKYADGISPEQATDLIAKRLAAVEQTVNELVKVPLGQNQYDALVSFVSDAGHDAFAKSTLLRLVNAGHLDAAPDEIRKWIYTHVGDAKVQSSYLAKKRAAEAGLFARPDAAPSNGNGTVARAVSMAAIDYAVPGPFEIIAQPSGMTCWAAVFAMMYCWRNRKSVGIRDALATVGGDYLRIFDRGDGIDSDQARGLYQASGLVELTSFEPSIDGWCMLLKKYGPLYVDVGVDASRDTHAVIVTGISGDGTPDGTSITYANPDGGRSVTDRYRVFMRQFELPGAVSWPYTIVHWPPAMGAAAALSITASSVYRTNAAIGANGASRTDLSRQQSPVLIAGIEVAEAAQIGLGAAAMVQAQVASTQGSFTLTQDKAERLLTNEARQAMPGAAKSGRAKYVRQILYLPSGRAFAAYASVVARWEGDSYGEIGTVLIERDLANSSEWSKSSANITFNWVKQIPDDGSDPRTWPIVYAYNGTFDPIANGYWEFSGEFELNAFGAIKWHKHEVYSRSLADWAISGEPADAVQRGPDVTAPVPAIPAEQLDYLKKHLP